MIPLVNTLLLSLPMVTKGEARERAGNGALKTVTTEVNVGILSFTR